MKIEVLKNKLINVKGKLNGNYKTILDTEEKKLIMSLYPLYDNLRDCCQALVHGDYKKCQNCNVIFPYGLKPYILTCSDTCRNILRKTKRIQTNLERYGVENASKNEDIKKKIQETNLERYGVKFSMHREDVKNKVKQTNLEKYGFDNPMKNDVVKYKTKQTNLEKYGSENVLNSEHTKNIIIDKRIEYIFQVTGKYINRDDIEKLNINENIYEYNTDYIKSLVENKMSKEMIDKQYLSTFSKYNKYRDNGYDVSEYHTSVNHNELYEFINNLNIKVEQSNRSLIKPYELDIYIPDHKLAIEFNGTYWHSDKFKNKNYHQMKTKMCNDQGITLIHVYEYLYNDKKDIYKSLIKAKLGLNERVYARKCILKEVPKQEEKEFLNKYHLQGFVGSSKCYGLYYNNELVTLCSFGKTRFNKNYEYELLRNCTLPNITVVGGLSKLIKHYKRDIDNKSILCYSDASISYNKNNNILTSPNYVWMKNGQVLKRYNTMKHKLKLLLGTEYNSELSESKNMIDNGFYRIFDSGNYITIY